MEFWLLLILSFSLIFIFALPGEKDTEPQLERRNNVSLGLMAVVVLLVFIGFMIKAAN